MSDVAIRVENLSKAYRIGLKEQRHETMLGAMAAWVKSPLTNYRNLRNLSSFEDLRTQGPSSGTEGPKAPGTQGPKVPESQSPWPESQSSSVLSVPASQRPSVPVSQCPPSDVFWALRNVSFEVKHGEVLGIIGRNGAGKSTLLKILSRITEPTSGRAEIYGRVGSLLEVGTGFHPDLTGRENIYLNGTILGMSKREVDRKFDSIVAFAEVEKFIDTPVKRYSSGMRVRLAFAVAAFLDPEILIVDEVLAVGDLNFQNKCLGKMSEVASEGRTVLFVSHNMAAVGELCQTGLMLQNGALLYRGTAPETVSNYVQQSLIEEVTTKSASASVKFVNFKINGSPAPEIQSRDGFVASVYLCGTVSEDPWIFLILEDCRGQTIVHSRRSLSELYGNCAIGNCTLTVSVPPLQLAPGIYSLHLKSVAGGLKNNSRIITERIPLRVRGDCDSLGATVLDPVVEWKLG